MPRASKRARAGTAADAEPATAAPAHTAFPADRGWTRWTTTWRWGVLRCVGEFLRREGLAEAATVLERECRRLPAGSAEGGTGDALGLFTTSGAAVDGGDGQPPAPVCSCCQEPAGVSGRIGVGVAMAGDLDALFVGAAILYGARRALAVDADDADALLDMLEEAAQMRRRRRLRYRFSEQEWATEARSRRRSSMTTANGAAGGCEETDVTTSERPRSRRKKQSQPRRTRRGRDNASAGVARFVEPIRDRLPDSSGDEEDAAGKGERGEVAPAVDGGRSHSTASVNDFAWLPSTARAGEARASVDNESMPEWMAQLAGTIAERINREHGDTRATAATAAAAGLETGAASAPAPPPPIAADAALERSWPSICCCSRCNGEASKPPAADTRVKRRHRPTTGVWRCPCSRRQPPRRRASEMRMSRDGRSRTATAHTRRRRNRRHPRPRRRRRHRCCRRSERNCANWTLTRSSPPR
eukprot:ctg_1300.g357